MEQETCWFGGTCEQEATYTVSGGHSVFGRDEHHVCSEHVLPTIDYMCARVPGWGDPLPCIVTPGIVEAAHAAAYDRVARMEAGLDADDPCAYSYCTAEDLALVRAHRA